MTPISANTRSEAWLEALRYLKDKGDGVGYNIILSIENPTSYNQDERDIEEKLDRLLSRYNLSLNTIAQTIFPASEYRSYGVRGVYSIYPEKIYPKIKKDWGTYAYRLVRKSKNGTFFNPLEFLVDKMKNELEKRGPKRACYEISLSDPSFECNLYQSDEDYKRRMGGPCLSHLSFKINHQEAKINLTAIYRSHYYIERALGNLRGLGYLMGFVAEQVGLEVGELVVHSSYAQIDWYRKGKWKKSETSSFLKEIL
ncbi:MAG: hypothetical protein OXB88_01490 [Bacteriovoracales bacterium]|nr:hypothetical protein [Bacteriovoracales bacterium]